MPITMTLDVPYRGAGAMQTASTVIEFETTSIDTGASITVAGIEVAVPTSIGDAHQNVGATGDGDVIQVVLSATDRVRLSLTYNGSFTTAGNYCSAPTAAAIAGRAFSVETSGLNFPASGAGVSIGYRITSLMAPGQAFCGGSYVRVPSSRPSLSIVAPDTPNKLGRFPLSIVLVLDKSGSMGSGMPADTNVIRWARLTASVEEFSNTWGQLGFVGAEDGHQEDRLGVLFFDSTVTEHELGGTGVFFLERGTASNPWTVGLNTAMNAPSPNGSTSIGAGLEAARQRLDDVDEMTGDTAIILFTDGEQNTSPCVLHQGETTSFGCTVTTGADPIANHLVLSGSSVLPLDPILAEIEPRGPIYTIGLGEDNTHAPGQLLDEIATETAGTAWFPVNGAAMDTAFAESLVNFLQGGTVSRLVQKTGSLRTSAAGTEAAPVAIDPSLTRAVFVLGWEEEGSELDLELQQPNGDLVGPLQVELGRRSLVARIDLPASGPSGTWQVRIINGNQVSGITAAAGFISYRLNVYGVESRLSFRVTESPRVGTDGPLQIVAELGWDDAGLADLPAGALRAVVERPGENLGNILHDTETPAIDPKPDQSPLAAKIAALIGSANLLERIEPRPVADSVPLQEVGHGRYEGSFAGVEFGGQYRIRVDFDWDDSRTGPIHREQVAERHATVVPTAGDTTVDVGQFGGSRGTSVLITPRDGFGNYVGPGYAGHFAVIIDGKPIAQPLTDPGLTGAYQLDLSGLPQGSDPRIEIRFRGKTLRDAPLSKLKAGGSGGAWPLPWWVWLLIVLVVLWLLF